MDKVTETKRLWIIGSIVTLLMLPIIFIMGLVVGINIEGTISLSQDNLSSWVAAFATVTIAVLTIVLAKETWGLRLIQLTQIEQIRKDSIKPSISLYLKSSSVGLNFIDVYIHNNGSGTAQKVQFKFTDNSDNAQNIYEYMLKKLNNLVILDKGISSLSADEHRTSYLFSFIDIHEKFGDKALELMIEVDILFEDIEGTKYSSKSYFNFTEYKGITELGGGDPLHKISNHLESIKKDIGHFASGFKKLKTDVFTSENRQEERDRLKKIMNSQE